MKKMDNFEILPPSPNQIHENTQSIAEAVTQFAVFSWTEFIRYGNSLSQVLYTGVALYYVLLQLLIKNFH